MNILLYLLLSLFFCNNVSVLSFKTKRLVNNFTMKKEKFKDNMKSLSQHNCKVMVSNDQYITNQHCRLWMRAWIQKPSRLAIVASIFKLIIT